MIQSTIKILGGLGEPFNLPFLSHIIIKISTIAEEFNEIFTGFCLPNSFPEKNLSIIKITELMIGETYSVLYSRIARAC